MAATPLTAAVLPRAPEPIGSNAQALYDEGLEHLRRLAGQTWTDHNIHDPGITTLELVTWALAELGYRANLPLTDLLTPPQGAPLALADQFHRARQVLPVRPLTALDWRKLLIDLPGVKNAWISPADAPPLYADRLRRVLLPRPPTDHTLYTEVRLHGLYQVAIDFMDAANTQAEREPVLRAVRATLERHRNLCEDFVAVELVPTQRFALCAELDLDASADVTEVAARLLFTAADAIAPTVPAYSLAQMLARPLPDGQPRSIDDIFDGPLLVNGFIDEADLAASELPDELRLSDLIGVLMDVPGVHAITDLVLNPLDDAGFAVSVPNRWRIPVKPGHLPRLAIASDGETPAGRLVFRKRGLPVAGWNIAQMPPAVRARLDALQEEARRAVETPREEDLPIPDGRWRELAAYRSVQRDFPPLYGLGEAGLAGNPDAQRQAQVLQLKAWLALFDQQIANDLAQLAQARSLLSIHPDELADIAERFNGLPEHAHTLASQRVDSIVGHDKIYAPGLTDTALAGLAETPFEAIARQHGLLDHLLARLDEDFSEYAAVMASAFGHSDGEVIADKCAFLADAAELGANRAGAYQQYDPDGQWNSDNVSGLEKRLARLLGIADFSRRNLGAVSYDTYAEIDTTPGDEFRFRVLRADDNKILLSSTVNFASREDARARMIEAIARGQHVDEQHYRIIEGRDGHFYFRIIDDAGRILARRVEGFATEEAARDAIANLAAYLRDHYSGEGLYVFENLLLRPQADDDPLLPICIDTDCSDCADADPYSWRLQIVLPAYAGRFQQMDFRHFVEHTIRSEVPAHLLPKICWVNADDMARFERAYRDWLKLHASLTRPSRADRQARLQALVDALTTMKNQYPRRTLFDCFAESPKPPFVLGSTALGSAPDHFDNQETDHG